MSLLHLVHERGDDPGPCRCNVCSAPQPVTSATTLSDRLERRSDDRPFTPEWRKRNLAKDFSGGRAA